VAAGAGLHGLAAEYVARLNREHALALRPGGPDSDTVAAHAFRGVVTLAVPDILREHAYPSTQRWALTEGFRALLAVPLAANAAQHGVLVAYLREPTPAGSRSCARPCAPGSRSAPPCPRRRRR
jgi:hypothetical protein